MYIKSLCRGRIIYDDKSIFQFVLPKKIQSGQARLVLNLKSASNNNLQNNKNISCGQINKTKKHSYINKLITIKLEINPFFIGAIIKTDLSTSRISFVFTVMRKDEE